MIVNASKPSNFIALNTSYTSGVLNGPIFVPILLASFRQAPLMVLHGMLKSSGPAVTLGPHYRCLAAIKIALRYWANPLT